MDSAVAAAPPAKQPMPPSPCAAVASDSRPASQFEAASTTPARVGRGARDKGASTDGTSSAAQHGQARLQPAVECPCCTIRCTCCARLPSVPPSCDRQAAHRKGTGRCYPPSSTSCRAPPGGCARTHPPTHPPSSRSVRDQQVPPTGPSPGRACEGMCAASMPSETPWVMAMCTPRRRAPATMPA